MKTRTLGVIGTGLIGGSVGAAARARGWHVIGYDPNATAQADALEAGTLDVVASREDLYARSEVVVIAAYADQTLDELRRLATEHPSAPRLIIDVASVKTAIAHAGESVEQFVATHPMAGTEHRGARHARADLFEGRTWAYVPKGNPRLDERARSFIASLGATPRIVDAAQHDATVALTSHLTQIVATAFAAQARQSDRGDGCVEALSGKTARELLRLGSAPLDMWTSVFDANGDNIARELRTLIASLERTAAELERKQ